MLRVIIIAIFLFTNLINSQTLELKIALVKNSFQFGEFNDLKLKIVNNSNSPVEIVSPRLSNGDLNFQLKRADGKEFKYMGPHVHSHILKTIPPGEYIFFDFLLNYSHGERITPSYNLFIHHPGEYELIAELNYGNEKIKSNKLQYEVLPLPEADEDLYVKFIRFLDEKASYSKLSELTELLLNSDAGFREYALALIASSWKFMNNMEKYDELTHVLLHDYTESLYSVYLYIALTKEKRRQFDIQVLEKLQNSFYKESYDRARKRE